ncbi:MAG TPA: energy transducer TonB [bacterium]|nr:energy transducer TonB [bacterium]
MFEERTVLRTNMSLVIAVAIHIAGILLLSRPAAHVDSAADLQEVSFMDVTYRPEVAKVLPRSAIPGGGGGAAQGAPADFGAGAPAYGSSSGGESSPIDMSAAMARDNSQAQINMNRYDLDRGSGMDVIRLGGTSTTKSTDEILAQPKVELARGLAHGGGSGGAGAYGLRGMPGVPQPQAELTIEHRELAKPAAAALPATAAEDLPKVTAPMSRGTNFAIAGPISQRAITRKVVPNYPKWALDRRVSGTVVVRVWVQPDGQVKGAPTVESSSGYPDLDEVVVDALRGWVFAPLGSGVTAEDQWGVITFKFMLA